MISPYIQDVQVPHLRQLVIPVVSACRKVYVDAVLKKDSPFLPSLLDNLNNNNKHLDSATKSLEALNLELATNSLQALKV